MDRRLRIQQQVEHKTAVYKEKNNTGGTGTAARSGGGHQSKPQPSRAASKGMLCYSRPKPVTSMDSTSVKKFSSSVLLGYTGSSSRLKLGRQATQKLQQCGHGGAHGVQGRRTGVPRVRAREGRLGVRQTAQRERLDLAVVRLERTESRHGNPRGSRRKLPGSDAAPAVGTRTACHVGKRRQEEHGNGEGRACPGTRTCRSLARDSCGMALTTSQKSFTTRWLCENSP